MHSLYYVVLLHISIRKKTPCPLYNFTVILRNYFKFSSEKNYTLCFFNLGISTMIFILAVASFLNILFFNIFVTIMWFYSLSTFFRDLGTIDTSMKLVLSCIHTRILSRLCIVVKTGNPHQVVQWLTQMFFVDKSRFNRKWYYLLMGEK